MYACTVFLYKQLDILGLDEGFKRTENWIKEDLRQKSIILFPIHKQHHWSLVVVRTKERVVHYLDSIFGSRQTSAAPRVIKRFMQKYHSTKGENVSYKVKIREDAPLQQNGMDCGVFLCQFAEKMARDGGLGMKERDMSETRKKMTEELLQGKIHEDWETYHGGKVQREKRNQFKKKKEARENVKVKVHKIKSETDQTKESESKNVKEKDDRKVRINCYNFMVNEFKVMLA